jgi:hypothetical protein
MIRNFEDTISGFDRHQNSRGAENSARKGFNGFGNADHAEGSAVVKTKDIDPRQARLKLERKPAELAVGKTVL